MSTLRNDNMDNANVHNEGDLLETNKNNASGSSASHGHKKKHGKKNGKNGKNGDNEKNDNSRVSNNELTDLNTEADARPSANDDNPNNYNIC